MSVAGSEILSVSGSVQSIQSFHNMRETLKVDDLASDYGSSMGDHTDHGDFSCELCDEDHGASLRCVDCKQNMCDTAAKLHRRTKSTKHHRMLPIHDCLDEDHTFRDGPANDLCIVCPQHQDTFRYYDRDCGCCICRDCFALTHTGHKCVTSGVAAKEFRVELEKSNKEVKMKIESFQEAEKALEEINRNLTLRYNELNEKLESTFEQLYNALLARHKVLQEELHNLYKSKVTTVHDQREKLLSMRKMYETSVMDSEKALSMNFEKVTDTVSFDTMSTEFILFYQKITKELKKISDKGIPDLIAETDESMELRVPEKSHQKLLETISAIGKISDGYASPALSKPEGEGLTVCVHKTRDEPMTGSFVIKAIDKNGKAKKRGGDDIKVILKQSIVFDSKRRLASRDEAENVNDKAFVSSVVDNNDGLYTINYTVNSSELSGEQEMSVLMNGEHVAGSPFRVMFVRKYQRNSGERGLSAFSESKSDKELLKREPEITTHRPELNNALVPSSSPSAAASAVNRLVSGANMDISANGLKAQATLNVAFCKLQYPLSDNQKVSLRRTKGGNPDIGYCDLAIFDSPNIPNTFAANGHIQGSKVFWRIWNGEFYYNGKLVSTNVHGQYQGQNESCKLSVHYHGSKITFYFNDVLVHSFNVPVNDTFYLYIRPYYQNSSIELLQ